MKAAIVDILLNVAVGWFHLIARILCAPLWILTMVGRLFFPNPSLADLLRAEPVPVRAHQ